MLYGWARSDGRLWREGYWGDRGLQYVNLSVVVVQLIAFYNVVGAICSWSFLSNRFAHTNLVTCHVTSSACVFCSFFAFDKVRLDKVKSVLLMRPEGRPTKPRPGIASPKPR